MKRNTESRLDRAFGFSSPFYEWTGKAFDLLAISVFWFLGCLPVLTIGASCSAMYAAVSRCVRRDIGHMSRVFWKSYLRDLRDSLPIWLAYAGAIFLLLLNIGILHALTSSLFGLFFMVLYAVVILLLVGACCYAFPALSRFDMPAGWIVKLSLYLTVRHLPTTLLLVLLFAAQYLLLFWQPMLVIIVPGVGTLLACFLTDSILDQHMPQDAGRDKIAQEKDVTL